ncbi:hypothetical protein [Clostridium paridis]|uniref:Uncharacterized protein n=1 Tax=Clostridium paridis TaxID=2803863 RepID=A0A937K4J1_9CLOT|nr:hypothetical protein [Clostridium paridis]MBL4931934.1 hypothetical protein [Clostridium paridis]
MNREFIKKIIKAEKLKYEAIKEILPTKVREKVEELENDSVNILKDVAVELLKEEVKETNSKSIKKVNIDFS